MSEKGKSGPSDEQPKYDLEERTFLFAFHVRQFVRKLPHTISNTEDVRQVVRSSGSVGANYIEANEAISKRDFKHRLKIARKESKETRMWLRLVDTGENLELEGLRSSLVQESTELLRIISAIIRNSGED